MIITSIKNSKFVLMEDEYECSIGIENDKILLDELKIPLELCKKINKELKRVEKINDTR